MLIPFGLLLLVLLMPDFAAHRIDHVIIKVQFFLLVCLQTILRALGVRQRTQFLVPAALLLGAFGIEWALGIR